MKELRHWLALLRTPGAGPVSLKALLDYFGTPEACFSLKKACFPAKLTLPDATRTWLMNPDWERVAEDVAWMSANQCRLLTMDSPDYPKLLATIPDPPVALFVQGKPELLNRPQLAIVGSRNPTHHGVEIARDFSRTLAKTGLVITSGLAEGIDTAAHSAALDVGGESVAVCGTGLDVRYPRSNYELAKKLSKLGTLISEFPLGTPAKATNFPRRNRIISGLSLGTLVVEAAHRSGSLITARLAAEQGREVFAIPGSINNALARGCHRLIRDGAKLVENTTHVIEELGPLTEFMRSPTSDGETQNKKEVNHPDYQNLLTIVGFDPTPVDVIVERTGLATNVVSAMLLNLELQGNVTVTPGGRYTRVT